MKSLICISLLFFGCQPQEKIVTRTRTYYVGVSPDIEKQQKWIDKETEKLWQEARAEYLTIPRVDRQAAAVINYKWEDYFWSAGYRDCLEALVFQTDIERAYKGSKSLEKLRAQREAIQ